MQAVLMNLTEQTNFIPTVIFKDLPFWPRC